MAPRERVRTRRYAGDPMRVHEEEATVSPRAPLPVRLACGSSDGQRPIRIFPIAA